ncbi:MAG: hydroxymethylbilane synthase [Alphaproteobacteria bacterium]|nr:hydroxymethylbilane synthase [Alphaproteobacteria bacterium]
MMQTLRIGTRGSPLALVQARLVATALRDAHGWGGERIEIVPITTTGDQVRDRPLAEIGGKALWTRELDRALREGITDISVHSMKDVETGRPPELAIVAMLPRADVRDRLIGAASVDALPHGARLGTSSPRRMAQMLARRPDLCIVPLRGNVDTRLRKIATGEADATLLASAGLDRLGKRDVGVVLDDFLPAPAQGAVGIEARADDRKTGLILGAIDHRPTHLCVSAERRLLEGLGGNCHSPIGALATLEDSQIRLRAELMSPDGALIESGETRFDPEDRDAPLALARQMLARAAPSIRALFDG